MFDNIFHVDIEHFAHCFISTVMTIDGMVYQFQFMADGTVNTETLDYDEWVNGA